MTDSAVPFTKEEIAELRPVMSNETWRRLLDVAEAYSRLHAEFGRECTRAFDLAEECNALEANRDEAEAAVVSIKAERDALRATNTQLRERVEHWQNIYEGTAIDLQTARMEVERLKREAVPLRRVALACRAMDAAANRHKYNFDEADLLDREMTAALAALSSAGEGDGDVSHGKCIYVEVPNAACQVQFMHGTIAHSQMLDMKTARGETMIVDFDENGLVLGIELLGDGKPCQQEDAKP